MRIRRSMACLTILIALLASSAPSVAQPHDHPGTSGTGLFILHDTDEEGHTFVGNLQQFGYVLLDQQNMPTTHKDGKIRVYQNDVLLFETHTQASGHDYDGLNTFYYTFVKPGPFRIEAEVPDGAMTHMANYTGYAHEPSERWVPAKLAVTVAAEGSCAFSAVTEIQAPDGSRLNHTDSMMEVRSADDRLLMRTHLHTHNEPMKFVAFHPGATQGGVLRTVGHMAFPTKTAQEFASVTEQTPLPSLACPQTPTPGNPAMAAPPPDTGSGYVLHLTYDPSKTAGTYGNVRINGLVLDDTDHAPVAHVDFSARVTGPEGRVLFASDELHEYDGVYEMIFEPPSAGSYSIMLTASRGDWQQTAIGQVDVAAGIPAAAAAGPGVVEVRGIDQLMAGPEAQSIQFFLRSPAGTPVQHSEVDFQITRGSPFGVPMLQNKLHTHGDGLMGFNVVFPDPDTYWLVLDPETLGGEPVAPWSVEPAGERALAVRLDVGGQAWAPVVAPPPGQEPPEVDGDTRSVPAAGGWAAVAALGVALAITRRSRP